ncbi:hypothetical protein BaRGS_00031137 [Batillaria attramentaria]|uniref:Uncharacterized protein n=1 Tax=Batillaria attramentaria TaxID=370345 RepID=A0ABD0JRG9_9CAEN
MWTPVLLLGVVVLVLIWTQFVLYSSAGSPDRYLAEKIRDGYSNNVDSHYKKMKNTYRGAELVLGGSNSRPYRESLNVRSKGRKEPAGKHRVENITGISNSSRNGGLMMVPLFQIRKVNGKFHDKWVVLDATSGDCSSAVMTVLPGWTVIVVGEITASVECKPPVCLKLEVQENITQHHMTTEEERLWKRNAAYLTAISHKALQIFDADCRTASANALRVLGFKSTTASGLMYNGTLHFNPYRHFGAWGVVPYALHNISLDREANSRLFDPSSPPVYVGQMTFTPVISGCSMYLPQAFWGLILPCLSDATRCDIMRQYITQRMLREVDAFSAYHHVPSKLNTEAINASSSGVKHRLHKLDFDADKLAAFLDSWICQPGLTLFACFQALASSLELNGFLDSTDVQLVKAWLTSIKKLGVAEPPRVATPWRGVRKISEVPVVLEHRSEIERSLPAVSLQKNFVDPVKTLCAGKMPAQFASVAQWRQPLMTDIVLVIAFRYNKFLFKNLPYLETLHRPFFKHIVYCTPNVTELMTSAGSGNLSHVTLVEGMSDDWYLMYECMASVARLGIQGVRGYLQIGDDTLLNTWMLLNLSRDSIWLPQGFTKMNAHDPKHRWGWYHWTTIHGRLAVLRTLSDLERISGMTSDQILRLDPGYSKSASSQSKTFSQILLSVNTSSALRQHRLRGSESWDDPSQNEAVEFLTNYFRVNRMSGKVAHRALDLFYVPHVLRDTFVKLSRYFMRHGVIIELALPVMHHGMVPKSKVTYVKASSLWYDNRKKTDAFYSGNIVFLHPFKLKAQTETESGRAFFCDVFLQNLSSKLSKFNTTDK